MHLASTHTSCDSHSDRALLELPEASLAPFSGEMGSSKSQSGHRQRLWADMTAELEPGPALRTKLKPLKRLKAEGHHIAESYCKRVAPRSSA